MANGCGGECAQGGRRRAADWIVMKQGDEELKAARPLCFVLMPFGRKTDATGRTTDFDAVYREIIAPAVNAAELDPIRADEEKIGGAIHKPMFERLMLCNYADRRHHRGQSQRLLRARHPPRDAAALDRDPVRRRHDPAVRHRAAARHSLSDQRAGHPVQSCRLRRRDRQAARRGEGEPARRQSAVSDARLHAAPRGRSHQDRHVPRPLQLFEAIQGPPGECAAAGRAGGEGNDCRSRLQEPARSSRPASWSTCS